MQLLGTAGGVRVYDSYAHHPDRDRSRPRRRPRHRRRRSPRRRLPTAPGESHAHVRASRWGRRSPPPTGWSSPTSTSLARIPILLSLPLSSSTPSRGPWRRPVGQSPDWPSCSIPDLRPGDMLLTLGAGDITTVGPAVMEALEGTNVSDPRFAARRRGAPAPAVAAPTDRDSAAPSCVGTIVWAIWFSSLLRRHESRGRRRDDTHRGADPHRR